MEEKMPEAPKTSWVAIYCRKSNEENLLGAVTSIDCQKEACRHNIAVFAHQGWREYPESFDDPGESGKNLKRPAMQRLLRAVDEGKVQIVIVYKLDRLTRSSKDFNQLIDLFAKKRIRFLSVTETIDTESPQGRLFTALTVQFAQYDRELDVERSKDFHMARARKGMWCGGAPPLGYDVKDKLLVVNNDEADIVRRVFGLYLEQRSTQRVADEINRLGYARKLYRTPEGKVYGGHIFDGDSVTRILRQKVYVGIVTNKRTRLEFPGMHESIVSPDIFARAQEILQDHVRRVGPRQSNKHGFILKSLARCGDCGGALVGYTRPKEKKVYRYYRCMARYKNLPAGCSFTSAQADKLERQVIEHIAELAWDRSFIELLVQKRRDESESSIKPLQRDCVRLQTLRQRYIREIHNLIMSASEGGKPDVTDLNNFSAKKLEVEAKLAEVKKTLSVRQRAVYSSDKVQEALKFFAESIKNLTPDAQEKILGKLVGKVRVWPERIEVDIRPMPIEGCQQIIDLQMHTDAMEPRSEEDETDGSVAEARVG